MKHLFSIMFLILITFLSSFGQVNVLIDSTQTWQGIPGLEKTAKGRVYISLYSGGLKEPAPENKVFLCYSDDQGKTFNKPRVMASQKNGARAFDPTLWIDPQGRLWYIFNRGNKETAEHGVYALICKNPDAKKPVWSEEFRLAYDSPYSFRMNKPTVLSSGEWIMPLTHATEIVHEWFAGEKQIQGVCISTDKGKSWKLHGSVNAPMWALETMIVELKDGRLWMLIRTGSGVLWESISLDKGISWSTAKATTIANPGTRFFIRRLSSGNLLLVNHYKFKGRDHLSAQLSTDDGKSWNDGLLLDERSSVSYPDGVQDKDGLIWIVYDRDRYGNGEILLSKFREEDVAAGKNISGLVSLKQVISKLAKPKLLPSGWNPKQAADNVMTGLVKVSSQEAKGAHDADFRIVGDRAFIVSMENDVKPGENQEWPYIFVSMSVVNMKTHTIEKIIPIARGGQVFENETLPPGACFVPRIIMKDKKTIRCFFASEEPGIRESQTWFIDFDCEKLKLESNIHRAKIKTSAGVFDMQPRYYYADAVATGGFTRKPVDNALYAFDFKVFNNKTYVVINNFAGGQNGLAVMNDNLDTFEVLGQYNQPYELKLTESAVNRLPDSTWMAICRQEGGNKNYIFTTSKDGKTWSVGEHREIVPNGGSSKPTFDKLKGVYYLGWQESTMINKVGRSVFNIDISKDGKTWERKYRFETEKSFQYPTFREYNGTVWLTVTQGDTDASRKERIMFGKLE